MPFLNPVTNENYTIDELAGAVIRTKTLKKQLSSRIKVKSDGLITNSTSFDRKQGKLGIISSKPVGAPPTNIEVGSFKPVAITVPHYPAQVTINPSEVVGQRVIGTKDTYLMPEALLQEKLLAGAQVLEAVEERQLLGAVRNQLIDDNGEVASDLSALGAPSTIASLNLSDASTDVPRYYRTQKRVLRPLLNGYNTTVYDVLLSPEDFERHVSHPSVREIWKPYRDSEFYRQDQGERGGFFITDKVRLVEYEGEELDVGNDFGLNTGELIIVPIADGLFRRFYAPKIGMSTVHSKGLPRYASSKTLDHDQGEEIQMETNVVTFCETPEAIGIGEIL